MWLGAGLAAAVGVAAILFVSLAGDEDSTALAPTGGVTQPEAEAAADSADGTDTNETAEAPGTEPEQTTVSDVGTLNKPAGLGETYVWEEWRGAVTGVVDAEAQKLLAEFSEAPAAGNVFLVVMYDITYTGSDITGFAPFIVGVSGSRLFDAFGCSLDPVALATLGRDAFAFELVPGQTARLAECFEVPAAEVDDIAISLDNVQQFGPEIIFAPGGGSLPDPGPVTATPEYSGVAVLPQNTLAEWEEWSGTITGLTDAEQAGLVSTLSQPSEDGSTYMAVTYDVTYLGTSASEFNPLQVAALGSAVFGSFGNCILDPDLLDAAGIEDVFELVPDQTASLAQCLEIPDDEIDSVVLRLSNPIEFRTEPFYYLPN
ncbi:MAG: hypothetical protein ACC660_05865 [Acidimicrobiales bacterium]